MMAVPVLYCPSPLPSRTLQLGLATLIIVQTSAGLAVCTLWNAVLSFMADVSDASMPLAYSDILLEVEGIMISDEILDAWSKKLFNAACQIDSQPAEAKLEHAVHANGCILVVQIPMRLTRRTCTSFDLHDGIIAGSWLIVP